MWKREKEFNQYYEYDKYEKYLCKEYEKQIKYFLYRNEETDKETNEEKRARIIAEERERKINIILGK